MQIVLGSSAGASGRRAIHAKVHCSDHLGCFLGGQDASECGAVYKFPIKIQGFP